MAKTVLTNVRCFAVAVDLTGVSNKIEVSSEVEAKDSTNYASEGYKEVMGGLASAEISGEVSVIGKVDYLEVWNFDRLKAKLDREPFTDDDARILAEYGI